MIDWIIAVLTVLIVYVIFVLKSTSGSDLSDNTIDAFIIQDDDDNKLDDSGRTKSQKLDKYTRSYLAEGRQVLILYGTEYGFSEEVARELFDRILRANDSASEGPPLQPRLVNMKYHHVIQWQQEQVCLVVVSTSGDGVPPSDARPFYDKIMESEDLLTFHYSVLALGDSNYPHFCKTGKMLDQRFSELSGKRVFECQTVDMEDWEVINRWTERVTQSLSVLDITSKLDYLDLCGLGEGEGYTRNNPFMATLKVKRLLTRCNTQSDKETIHCKFDIAGSGLTWTSGDALGIFPENNPTDVEAILKHLKFTGTEEIATPAWAYFQDGDRVSLRTALTKYFDLKHIKPELLKKLCCMAKDPSKVSQLRDILNGGKTPHDKEAVNFIQNCEVCDVLEEISPCFSTPGDFVCCLKPLQPRFYSISSSPLADTINVCVTAAVVRYSMSAKEREGVTTTYLQDRLSVGDQCPVFMSRNPDFRLPSNHRVPVILIGPGTGIAPFRAFIQERALCSTEERGPTHLYFGCRHRHMDYLYQDELELWAKQDVISLRVAFSRDQSEKIYVQDLLRQDSQKIWRLLHEEKAHIFVCGDAKNMAHDVHRALVDIYHKNNEQTTHADSENFYRTLEQSNRYQKDVWVT